MDRDLLLCRIRCDEHIRGRLPERYLRVRNKPSHGYVAHIGIGISESLYIARCTSDKHKANVGRRARRLRKCVDTFPPIQVSRVESNSFIRRKPELYARIIFVKNTKHLCLDRAARENDTLFCKPKPLNPSRVPHADRESKRDPPQEKPVKPTNPRRCDVDFVERTSSRERCKEKWERLVAKYEILLSRVFEKIQIQSH